MEGFEDPFCRVCYPWGHEDAQMLVRYQAMTAMRNAHPVLRTGECVYLAPCADVLGVIRKTKADGTRRQPGRKRCAVTLINRSAKEVVVYLTAEDVAAQRRSSPTMGRRFPPEAARSA